MKTSETKAILSRYIDMTYDGITGLIGHDWSYSDLKQNMSTAKSLSSIYLAAIKQSGEEKLLLIGDIYMLISFMATVEFNRRKRWRNK